MLRTLTDFRQGYFFELLTEIWRGKGLKNIFFAAVSKKFTILNRRKGTPLL